MNEKEEVYKHIYQDAEMACYTLEELIKDLKEKDNKIKRILEDIFKKYRTWKEQSEIELKKLDVNLEEKGFMSKMMASMGIKKEVKNDNSDSSMADLLIQGISMGSINSEKIIKSYEKDIEKETLNFVKKFLKFQQDTIEKLKQYL